MRREIVSKQLILETYTESAIDFFFVKYYQQSQDAVA